MNSIFRIVLAILLMSIATPWVYASDSYIILESNSVSTMLDNIKYIEDNGGKITHRFPPNILIGDIPAEKIKKIKGQKNIKDITTEKIDISKIKDKKSKIVASVWNTNYKDKKTTPDKSKLKPIENDVIIINKTEKKETKLPYSHIGYSPPSGAGWYDTSEYMIGDVAVGIVLLESNGYFDLNSEDWTYYEESKIISEINSGLNWWASQDARSRLTFTYDIYYNTNTNYEPISRSSDDQYLWISDAMTNMGFNYYYNYWDNVYDFNNKLRDSMNTDWAYTIFVVDSSNDWDGKFTNGRFGYAYLGGPFTVMTYDNNGWGVDNFDKVTAHETGHIFYATDEYDGYQEYSGYLNAPEIVYSNCIMDNNNFCISSGTKLQLGWMDNNNNNVFDIIDFYPISQLTPYIPDPTNSNTLSYSGISTSSGKYPNNNPYGYRNYITINKIINAQYRVDYGLWRNAYAYDGLYDNSYEEIAFTTPWLYDGYHTIDIRARNTAGIWEDIYSSDTILIDTSSITLQYPNGGEIFSTGSTYDITWTKTGYPGDYVKIELLKAGSVISTISSSSQNDGLHSWYIPTTQALGTDYKIKITSTSNSAYTDTSNNNFAITSGTSSITVVSPNGGENWIRGTNKEIKWSSSGSPGANVKIDLYKAGVWQKTIVSSTPNDGSFIWYVPTTQILGTDYKIKIISTSNSAYYDWSNNNFIISAGSITVTSPNGGESWQKGTTKTITWSRTGTTGSYVKIDLYKAGVWQKTIVSSTPNDGSHPWYIPTTQMLGTDYKIKVTSTSNSAYNDWSNNNFKIY